MMKLSYKKFLLIFITASLIILFSVISFNWFINPYGIFDSPKIDGINLAKPKAKSQYRMSLAYAITRQNPAGIILGSSRALVLPSEHPGWSVKPISNLAIAGSSMYEMYRYFEHTLSQGNLKQIVLAVDFFQFNQNLQPGINFIDNRLFPKFELQPFSVHLKDIKSSLLSIEATLASYSTLTKQPNITRLSQPSTSPVRSKKQNVTAPPGGHRQAFIDIEKLFLTKLWFPLPCRNFTLNDTSNTFSSIKAYHDLLKKAYSNNIELRILISPSHARLWQALELTGLLPQFESWKKELVKINEDVAHGLGIEPFPIWDFSGYNDYTTEAVPKMDQSSQAMQWYVESSHYRNTLANLVFDEIFNTDNGYQDINFGVKLNDKNIDDHLKSIKNKALNYKSHHPEDIAELTQLVLQTSYWRKPQCQ